MPEEFENAAFYFYGYTIRDLACHGNEAFKNFFKPEEFQNERFARWNTF